MTTTSSITIAGNLTRDAEIRCTRDGQATTALSVAVNRRWQNRQTQEWEESTSFFDVVCWRDLAENAALSLTRGARIVVTGRLEQRAGRQMTERQGPRSSWWPMTSVPASVLPPWTSTRWSGTPQPRIPSHPKRSSDHQASGVPPGTPLLRVRSSRGRHVATPSGLNGTLRSEGRSAPYGTARSSPGRSAFAPRSRWARP